MNDDGKQFEQRLRGQPMKPVPPAWREEILAAARSEAPRTVREARLHGFAGWSWWSGWFRPPRLAWAGLVAVWVGIAAVQLAMREPSVPVAKLAPPPSSAEVRLAWRQQQRLCAELLGTTDSSGVAPQRILFPRPRSQRLELRTV